MKNILLCYVTDSKNFDYIDKEVEELKKDLYNRGQNTLYTYIAVEVAQGLTTTDTDEIEYILQCEKKINYLVFAAKEEQMTFLRPFARYFVDKGYIVFFRFY